MKKLLFVSLFLILILASVAIWFYQSSQPVSSNKAFKDFLITKGSSAGQIGKKLQDAGLVKSTIAFKIYTQFTGVSGKIVAGEYKLTPSYSLFQVVNQLTKGPLEIWVTIPEGLRREEIAIKFKTALDKDDAFVSEFLLASKGKEGYLFPETYLFPKDITGTVVVKKMLDTFDIKTKTLSLTKDQVILASLLERETKTNAERPIVAGILMNRLNAGMPLQVDASVQYAIGNSKDWWPILTLIDLKINSPYNLYKFTGLPPTPIANAGFSSFSAAFNPTSNDYWYYIHDTSGVIHYAKTLAEHNANVRKYLGK